MPSKHIFTTNPPSVTGGGGTTTIDAFTDSFSLKMTLTDGNAVPTDQDNYNITLTQADSNADLSETLQLQFPAPDFADSNTTPSESNNFTMRIWLSGSASSTDYGATDAPTNPANANGQNDGAVATMQTAVAGNSRCVLKSNLGANLPSGVTITSAIYRCWFKSVNTLITSEGRISIHSSTGLFIDAAIFSNVALNTTVDHLSGDFTYDLIAGGVNTLAKLQSLQMYHLSSDGVSGVTPHVFTLDAGCIELAGAFT